MKILWDEDRGILVDDYKRASWAGDMDDVIIVHAAELNKAGMTPDDFKGLDLEEVRDLLWEKALPAEELPYEGYFVEPEEGEFVVVYPGENYELGDDLYFWDYDLKGVSYWDGSEWKDAYYPYAEDVLVTRGIEVKDGRYYVLMDEDNDLWGCFENDREYGPADCALLKSYDEKMSDDEVKDLIDSLLF